LPFHLSKAAYHEASHVAVAHAFHLPIKSVWIAVDGSGYVKYTRRFHYPDIEVWIIATLAGGIVERERWASAADGGDMRAIENMVRDMRIVPWPDSILNGYLVAAKKFVREKNVIEIILIFALPPKRGFNSDILRMSGVPARTRFRNEMLAAPRGIGAAASIVVRREDRLVQFNSSSGCRLDRAYRTPQFKMYLIRCR
jgi:hypothetical protein